MKKLLYTFLFVASSVVLFSSCTEDEVNPKTETTNNGGGSGAFDPL